MRGGPWFLLGLVLALLGVAFYLVMGLQHGSWTDVGVYSVTIVLLGFGIVGALVARGLEAEAS